MTKQQLAAKIWDSANKMRSRIEANEYKDYILGFIFYKFLSEKERELLRLIEFGASCFNHYCIGNDTRNSMSYTMSTGV